MTAEDDASIRQACHKGDAAAAVTLLLERYGAELFGYLSALLRNNQQARETYCLLAEDLWRGLPKFEWRCSARAWAYALARNARSRYLLAEQRRTANEQVLANLPWFQELIQRTHTSTPIHLRTEIRERVEEIRNRLPEDEQTLIMLRVDRRLSWKELAVVLGEVGDEPSPSELARTTARLRQRFHAVKEKLRKAVEAEGLLADRKD
jgi:RNA polymerase sigma-70 factor (ECF subfamily)